MLRFLLTDINRAYKYLTMGKFPAEWAGAEAEARDQVRAARGKSREVRKHAFERHSDVMYRAGKAIVGESLTSRCGSRYRFGACW
jgi:hypothetical protein